MSALTDADRVVIEQARELTRLKSAAAVRAHSGETSAGDTTTLVAYVGALWHAQNVIGDLLALVDRLAGQDSSEEESRDR